MDPSSPTLCLSPAQPTRLAPEGRQMDWEAILRPDAETYAAAVKPWIIPSLLPMDEANAALCVALEELKARYPAEEAPPRPPTDAAGADAHTEFDGPVMTAQPRARFAAAGEAPQRAVLPTQSAALLADPLPTDTAVELSHLAQRGADAAAAVDWVRSQPRPAEPAVRGVDWAVLPPFGAELGTVGTAVAALLA